MFETTSDFAPLEPETLQEEVLSERECKSDFGIKIWCCFYSVLLGDYTLVCVSCVVFGWRNFRNSLSVTVNS